MKTIVAAAFAAGVSMLALSSACAMPVIGLDGARPDIIITVAGGCGRGFHRGPYGGCLRNYAVPADHPCPRGFHVGPYGGCRANGR
jgi:hypothetical protein